MKTEATLPAPTDKAAPLVIDIATNAEAARVGELVRAAGWDLGNIEFTEVHPYWLVAKDAGVNDQKSFLPTVYLPVVNENGPNVGTCENTGKPRKNLRARGASNRTLRNASA